jgi:hypothetical protein
MTAPVDVTTVTNVATPVWWTPTEVAALLTIAGAALAGVMWALGHVFVAKKVFYNLRREDEKAVELAKKNADDAIRIALEEKDEDFRKYKAYNEKLWETLEQRTTRMEKEQATLIAGPIDRVASALMRVETALETFNDKSEKRNEETMKTLQGIDRRVITLEARRQHA